MNFSGIHDIEKSKTRRVFKALSYIYNGAFLTK